MALSLYSYEDIVTKVRNLTGHKDSNDITDATLGTYVNRYYQLMLPLDIRPYELMTWFQFDTVSGTSEYDLTDATYRDVVTLELFNDGFLGLESPITVAGYPLTLYLNPTEFYGKWTETTTHASSRPTDVLWHVQSVGANYKPSLTFRYLPDDTYRIKFGSWKRPVALTAGTFPLQEEWGPLISYGASIEVAEDNGDMETLQKLEPLFQRHKSSMQSKTHFQNIEQRSIPRF